MKSHCEKIRDRIPEIVSGNLRAEESAEVRRHIDECQTCSKYYQALMADDTLLRDFAEEKQIRVDKLERNVINTMTQRPWRRWIGSPQKWRTIATSSISKLVAAVIIVGTLLMVNYFVGSVDGSATVLARILEKMKQSAWVYSVCEMDSPRGKSVWQTWKSFEPHIHITKRQDGTIKYTDYSKKVEYQYNPNSNVVTVRFRTGHYLLPDPNGPFETISRVIQSAKDGNAKMTRQMTSVDGAEAEVIRIVYNNDPQKDSIVMIRDVERNVLTRMEAKGTSEVKGKTYASVTTFDYPEDGPKDIYALGVPKEANIVDLRPEGPAMALIELIQNKFKKGYGDHLAVVLTSWVEEDGSLDPSSVSVFRRKGDLRRSDQYHAYNFQNRSPRPGTLYEEIKDVWPDVTMPQILKLLDDRALYRQMLFDGEQTITQHNDRLDGDWKSHVAPMNTFKISNEDSLAGLVWTCPYRLITSGPSHMKQEVRFLAEDPNHPGLVGFQFLKYAQTDAYWFDPNKDYILVEFASRRAGSRPLLKIVVTQTNKTTDGRWYPSVIRTEDVSRDAEGRMRTKRCEKRILLDTSPAFEQDVFDASRLQK
jgi:hypothetical protein